MFLQRKASPKWLGRIYDLGCPTSATSGAFRYVVSTEISYRILSKTHKGPLLIHFASPRWPPPVIARRVVPCASQPRCCLKRIDSTSPIDVFKLIFSEESAIKGSFSFSLFRLLSLHELLLKTFQQRPFQSLLSSVLSLFSTSTAPWLPGLRMIWQTLWSFEMPQLPACQSTIVGGTKHREEFSSSYLVASKKHQTNGASSN